MHITTPVFHHPPIKEVNIPKCTAFCSFSGVAVPPECLQTVDRDGCFAYCVPCLAVFSQTEDFSSHALAASSNSAPLLLNNEDSQYTLHESPTLHESSLVEEFSSASVPFSSELGSSPALGNFSEFGSPRLSSPSRRSPKGSRLALLVTLLSLLPLWQRSF